MKLHLIFNSEVLFRKGSFAMNKLWRDTPAIEALDGCRSTPREIELIHRIQLGGTELLPELIAPHLRRIKALAFALLRDDSAAEDVVQDTILKVMLHLKSIRSRDCFGHWVLQIARNVARTRLRRERKHLFETLDGAQHEDADGVSRPSDVADVRPGPLATLEQREIQSAIVRAVGSLRTSYRQVWELTDVAEAGIAEAANILGISEANAMSRLRRARKKLREALAPVIQRCAKCDREVHSAAQSMAVPDSEHESRQPVE
jgi:RNA polymerase sigma-70 factor (ECF subfamily)